MKSKNIVLPSVPTLTKRFRDQETKRIKLVQEIKRTMQQLGGVTRIEVFDTEHNAEYIIDTQPYENRKVARQRERCTNKIELSIRQHKCAPSTLILSTHKHMVSVDIEDRPRMDAQQHMKYVMLEDVKCPAEVGKLREMHAQSYIAQQHYTAEYILKRIRTLRELD